MTLGDADLLRYARHILLDDIGVEGQTRLAHAQALIVGAGGLGSPAALYLASAGVGRILLVDHDVVELTNLQRQIAHADARIGQAKVDSARTAMRAINPTVSIHAHACRADAAWLDAHVPGCDVVLDCTDNFATRQAVNAACVRHGVPLVWGAAIGFDAQLSAYDPRAGSACYACAFAPDAPPPEQRCATMGVFAPLVGIVGSLQAADALHVLLGRSPQLAGRLLLVDGRRLHFSDLALARQPRCPICQTPPPKI